MRWLISIVLTLSCLQAAHGSQVASCQALEAEIGAADGSLSLDRLVALVRMSSAHCRSSPAVSAALTGWLREDHPLYAGRTPTEASQFRGFLMASLGAFPPNADLYGYVRSELLFGGHVFGIATAAVAARSFPDRAAELVPLLEPFLGSAFEDQWVDVTTPDLNYPVLHPTKARQEIIRTLAAFGAPAYRSVKLLEEIAASDPDLARQAAEAAEAIVAATPPCCRKEAAGTARKRLRFIDGQDRKELTAGRLKLLDQEGRSLRFQDLVGKPFVLTFFYTQCTNALKCVATVDRLGELEAGIAGQGLAGWVGIYGMTYDPGFDSPSILRKYGEMYGVRFSDTVRFLKPAGGSGAALHDRLKLRVSYGAGTVNQHGIQLFVFDRKGRLAATSDNDLWVVDEVKDCLIRLAAE